MKTCQTTLDGIVIHEPAKHPAKISEKRSPLDSYTKYLLDHSDSLMILISDKNLDDNPIKSGKISYDDALKIMCNLLWLWEAVNDDPVRKGILHNMALRAWKHLADVDNVGVYYDRSEDEFIISEPGKPDTTQCISLSTIINENRLFVGDDALDDVMTITMFGK